MHAPGGEEKKESGRRGLVVASVVLMLGCGADRNRGGAQPVRVAFSPGEAAATLSVAEELGAFRDRGVAVEWVTIARPSGALPELATGHLDVIVARVSVALFSMVSHGGRVRIVADRGQQPSERCALHAVLVRKDLDPANLPRRVRVAAAPATVAEFMLDRVRASVADAEEWTFVDLPSSAEAQALAMGAVELVATGEPHLTRLQDAGLAKIWRTYAQIYPSMQHYVLVFGPRLLDRERELGVRFLAAYLQAERRLAQGKTDRNVALMAAALDLDADLVRRMCWALASDDLKINEASLLDYQRWATTKGLLDHVVLPEQFWDGELAARAVSMLGRQEV